MPTAATMTSAPKKKRDFFNGSQPLNMRDFRSPEPQQHTEPPRVPQPHYINRDANLYPLPPVFPIDDPPPPPIPTVTNTHYAFQPVYPETRGSPTEFYSLGLQDRSPPAPPIGLDRGLEYGDSPPLAEAPQQYPTTPPATQEHLSNPPTSAVADDSEGATRKKRKQRCRLCANHGIYVEIKGHKWFCPYKHKIHHCEKCEITKKRRFFMAEQQKLTREQQQQLQINNHLRPEGGGGGGGVVVEGSGGGQTGQITHTHPCSDFPRLQELIDETDDIIDEGLLRRVNDCVKPRVSSHH